MGKNGRGMWMVSVGWDTERSTRAATRNCVRELATKKERKQYALLLPADGARRIRARGAARRRRRLRHHVLEERQDRAVRPGQRPVWSAAGPERAAQVPRQGPHVRRERPELCAALLPSSSLQSLRRQSLRRRRSRGCSGCTSSKAMLREALLRAVPFYDEVHGVYHLMYQDHVCIAPGHGPDIGHVVSRDFVSVARPCRLRRARLTGELRAQALGAPARVDLERQAVRQRGDLHRLGERHRRQALHRL